VLVIYGHGGNLGTQRVKSRVMHILSDAAALKVQPLCVVNLFQPSCLCYLIIMTICVCVVRNSLRDTAFDFNLLALTILFERNREVYQQAISIKLSIRRIDAIIIFMNMPIIRERIHRSGR